MGLYRLGRGVGSATAVLGVGGRAAIGPGGRHGSAAMAVSGGTVRGERYSSGIGFVGARGSTAMRIGAIPASR